MSNSFGSVGKQLGGLAKHVAKKVVREPLEVLETAVGVMDKGKQQDGKAMGILEQGGSAANSTSVQASKQVGDDIGKPKGFQTQEDYQKYQELARNRDQVTMRLLRRKLANEWGVEKGMQQARQEYQQKLQEKEQVEVQEKQVSEAMMFEKTKKDESIQVRSAKNQASSEKGKGMVG